MEDMDFKWVVPGLATITDGLLRCAFDEVMRASFNDDELPSWEWLSAGFQPGGNQIALVALEEGDVAGVAVGDLPTPGTVSLLSYLAVRPGRRGRGLGGELMRRLRERWALAGVCVVLGEVHDPRVHAESSDEHPKARLQFYERSGAELVGLPWVQPALSPSSRRVPGMLLVALYRGWDCRGTTIGSTMLHQWGVNYYAEYEGDVPPDAQLLALWHRFTEHATVPVGALGEYRTLDLLAQD